jgi:iron complex outermembrane receptor protein
MNFKRIITTITFGALLTNVITVHSNIRVIEEVIVTAQKKAQNLQDVPISVSSFDRDFIADLGVTDIGQLVQYTPNVKFDNSFGGAALLTIRGFGTPPLANGLEPSVGLTIDDVFYGRSYFINDANFDLEQMEVLRGPQGTLYGKNTIAGVFSIRTRDPEVENTAYFNAGRADYDEVHLQAGASIELIEDVLAARISLRSRNRDSHLFNTARNEQNTNLDYSKRLKLKWFISDTSDLLFNAWTSKNRQVGLILQLKQANERSMEEFRKKDPLVEAEEYNNLTSMNRDTFSKRDTKTFSVKYSKELGSPSFFNDLAMNLIFSRSKAMIIQGIDGDFSPIDFIDFGTDKPSRYEQDQLELRFNGGLPAPFDIGLGVDFVAGVFISESEQSASVRQTNGAGFASYIVGAGAIFNPFPGVSLPGPGVPDIDDEDQAETLHSSTDVDSESIAWFMQYDWFASDSITVTFGLRYGEDWRYGHVVSYRDGLPGAAPVTTGQTNYNLFIEDTDYDFTPKLTLSWQALDDLTLFATATEGFKSGGFAAGVFRDDNLTFEPEQATAYEMGFKSKWLGGSLIVNGAIYHTSYQNLQVQNFDGRSIFVKNAADAEAKGFEFDFFWLPPVPYMSIGGSAGFVDASYIEYLCAPVNATQASNTTATGDDSCYNDATGSKDEPLAPSFQDLSGAPLAYAPKASASLYNTLTIPLVDLGINVIFGIDALYQGEHFIDTDNDPNAFQEATTKFNTRLGLKADDGHWSFILNVRNLTEEKESVLVIDQPLIPGNYVSAALPHKTFYQLDFKYEYR